MGMPQEHLTGVHARFGLDIKAALALGDMNLLALDIEWMEGLLRNHDAPGELLPRYLSAYYRAAKTHLDERGAPIVNHLALLAEG
jgi:hypothetical protein